MISIAGDRGFIDRIFTIDCLPDDQSEPSGNEK